MQVPLREGQIFGEGTWVLDDSQHGAMLAVAAQVNRTEVAVAACQVDFASDALAEERSRIGLSHNADKLMSRYPRKAVVAALQF